MKTDPESIAKRIYTRRGFAPDSLAPLKVLHLGCGLRKLPGAVGIDSLALTGVDVVHDLEQTPWPFADGEFDVILAHAVLEHLRPFISVMEEIHRVGKKGARVVISVPYFRSTDAIDDPTHVHLFTARSMDYILDDDNGLAAYSYTRAKFKKIGFWYGWPLISRSLFSRVFKKFIQHHQRFYDQYLSLLRPVQVLTWELEIIK